LDLNAIVITFPLTKIFSSELNLTKMLYLK